MNEYTIFNNLILGWFILAAVVFILLFFFTAPYGRHSRSRWGSTIENKTGWLVMETPAPLMFAVLFLFSQNAISIAVIILLVMWEAHYIHRAFIYPFSLRSQTRRMPVVVVVLAFVFNIMNGYLNGRYIFTLSEGYTNDWLLDARFIIGLVLFIAGFVINRHADLALRKLREPGESDYKIPYGGMYNLISCPNYFGEILTWTGWAVATWSLPGLAFAVWTAANLVPRARAHHSWYHEHFANYPQERKALVPLLW